MKLKQNSLMLKEKRAEIIYFNVFLLKMLLTLVYSHKTFLIPHSHRKLFHQLSFTTFTEYA